MSTVLSLAHREILRFLRQPSRLVGAFAPPLLAWLLIGSGFGSTLRLPGADRDASYLVYFYPGAVVLVVLFASVFSTISVIEDRREGFLQGVIVSPASPFAVAAGKILGGSVLALLQGAALLVIAPFLGTPLAWPPLLAAGLVLGLIALALTGLGLAIAWSLESTQGYHAIMNLFLFPLWFLSGAFFPVSGAPLWLRVVMEANPLTYGVASLRGALRAVPDPAAPSLLVSIGVTAGFALGMAVLATAVIARSPLGRKRPPDPTPKPA